MCLVEIANPGSGLILLRRVKDHTFDSHNKFLKDSISYTPVAGANFIITILPKKRYL